MEMKAFGSRACKWGGFSKPYGRQRAPAAVELCVVVVVGEGGGHGNRRRGGNRSSAPLPPPPCASDGHGSRADAEEDSLDRSIF